MMFKAHLRAGVAAICIASLCAPVGVAKPAASPEALQQQGPLDIRVAQAKDISRIEFRWAGGARVTSRRDGQTLTLRFSRYAKPDMTRLRVDPPRWLKAGQDAKVGGALQITLTLEEGADAKVGEADGATFVNIFSAKSAETQPVPAAPQTAQAAAQPAGPPKPMVPPPHPDAVPAGGVVKMTAEMANGHVLLRFPWKSPLGAAVFRRGGAIWVVFDSAARLDLSGAPHGFRQVGEMRAVQGADYSAVRIDAPPDINAAAIAEGGTWTVVLASGPTQGAEQVKIGRNQASPAAGLTVTMAGSTKAVWVDDPVVGDKIGVVTALSPAKGVPGRREFVDLALLDSAQGLAVEPSREDIAIATDGDIVDIGRPNGLSLSPQAVLARSGQGGQTAEQLAAPQPASLPGLVEYNEWSKLGSDGFVGRYDALQRAAANEVASGQGGQAPETKARMALARFLIGSQLAFEAIGVLDMTGKANQSLLGDPEFRALRGAAKAMAGRYKEAQADLSTPSIADDPASSLWRGYVAQKLGENADARAAFASGAAALFQFDPLWRARFARADAEAALALGQLPVAEVAVDDALRSTGLDPDEELATRLVQARLFEAQGQKARALRVYQAISAARMDYLAAPAQLHATQIRFDTGQITPIQAANSLDGLRYRWRGDATELDTIRELGQIYISLGRYREALEALRSAGQRLPDLPQAVQLQDDLRNAFRTLFLDGQADGLQPIQALALFYDFKELTPVGADGDQMVRRLARRLVDVDLLSQAADLLKYQAEHRLDGVPRAEVATDLATIQLMNRQPEAAIEALNSSRSTLLPTALTAQRRLIEARAWLGLGQYDHALEILENDKAPDADSIRAEVDWKKHDWAGASALFERRLGDRWKNPAPLNPDEEAALLRAGVALSLAGDEAGLTRLRTRYQGYVNGSHAPDALRVALSGLNGAQLTGSDFTKAAAENDSFASWVQSMKQRFRDSSNQASAATPPRG
ncbi:tetratricopeptide repeat protein [Phenylobacterium montanum]|uniref:Endoglucanase n=1 Tax=Phenylobacterium montanum TaxID=2823693 RepID=A0A975IUI2_9CAUL|nr:endoglucanase [Caulobacter sp. S6]QUD87828.1 endoglucanase [Caulobacter sp. S6]